MFRGKLKKWLKSSKGSFQLFLIVEGVLILAFGTMLFLIIIYR